MTQRIVTLLTDFGHDSPYVASMKGVLLSISPGLTLVDISHAVPPQNVRHGAYVLAEASRWFPEGTIHIAVVDPGVGTERKVVYVEAGSQCYIAPDNGLLGEVVRRDPPTKMIALTEPKYWLFEVSHTFHGRDIMAPAAAHLSLGVDPAALGEPLDSLECLAEPAAQCQPGRIAGEIVWIDHFGNLVTNIEAAMLDEALAARSVDVQFGRHGAAALVRTYGDAAPGELVALIGSNGRLEVAIVNGSAAQQLGGAVGDEVTIAW